MQATLLLLSLALGAGGAWLVARHGHALGLLDHPNQRSSHAKVTPRGGGVGIVLACLAAGLGTGLNWLIWTPAILLAAINLYEDRFHISPKTRLLLQFGCAFVSVGALLYGKYPFGLLWLGLLAFGAFFVVASANYYNFMDGINGIAGITGVVGFSLLAWQAGPEQAAVATFSLSIAAGCLGFLPLNFPRARVFMGDVASVLLGFLFAGLAGLLAGSLPAFICLASFIFPFYADEFISILLRIKQHKSLLEPHRGHLYQLICNELRVPHWQVSLAYGGVQLLIAIVATRALLVGWLPLCLWLAFCLGAFGVAYYVVTGKVRRLAGQPKSANA